MSVARPAHGLLGRCLASTRSSRPAAASVQCAQFHSSAVRSKRRSRFRNVKAEELGLLSPSTLAKYRQEKFPEYSKQDQEALRSKYTPEQLEALRAGEKAVDPGDLVFQGRLRDDPYRPNYVEDYTVLDPRYDLRPQPDVTPREPEWLNHNDWVDRYGARMAQLTDKKTTDQLTRAMVRALRRVKESNGQELIDLTEDELKDIEKDPELLKRYLVDEDGEGAQPEPDANASGPDLLTRAQAMKLDEAVDAEWKKELDKLSSLSDPGEVQPSNLELVEDGPAGATRVHSAEAVELGKVPGVEGLYKSAVDPEDEGQDDAGHYQEIKRLTGMSLKDIQSIYRKVLVTRWVSNQTRLGKVRSTSVVAIAGNGNGRLGLGIAKSTEAGLAAETAQLLAIRNMKPIRRYENRTVYGNVSAKVSGTVVELFARPPGKAAQAAPSPPTCTVNMDGSNEATRRLWPPLPAPHLRNVPRLGPARHRGAHAALQEPHELGQGRLQRARQPARPRGDCHWPRQEDGGRAQGVLRRRCILREELKGEERGEEGWHPGERKSQEAARPCVRVYYQLCILSIEGKEEREISRDFTSKTIERLPSETGLRANRHPNLVSFRRVSKKHQNANPTASPGMPSTFKKLVSFLHPPPSLIMSSALSPPGSRPLSAGAAFAFAFRSSLPVTPILAGAAAWAAAAAPPVNLLLQHDAVHARLEQRKRQARLALQLAQPVEDLRRRPRGQVVEHRRELNRTSHQLALFSPLLPACLSLLPFLLSSPRFL